MKKLIIFFYLNCSIVNAVFCQLEISHYISTQPVAFSYEMEDLNGDGLLDIYGKPSTGWPEIHLNNGNFTFTPVNLNRATVGGRLYKNLGFVDYDNDGDKDIVTMPWPSSLFQKELEIYRNDNFNQFVLVNKIEVNEDSNDNIDFRAADFNNDGLEDLIMSLSSTRILYNQGGGNFDAPLELLPAIDAMHIHIEDINADNKPDIIVFGEDAIVLYINNSSGFDQGIELPNSGIYTSKLTFTDLNGDGRMDFTSPDNGNIDLILSKSDYPYFEEKLNFYDDPSNGNVGHNLIDIDRDGDLDIIHGLVANYGTFVKINNGSEFSESELFSQKGVQNALHFVADLNNDGVQDFFAKSKFRQLHCADISNGVENIKSYTIGGADAILLIDVNNDLQDDILIYNEGCLYTRVFAGDYGPIHSVSNQENIRGVSVIDFDNDGDDDIIARGSNALNEAKVFWYENLGGIFAEAKDILEPGFSDGSFQADDFDNDGDIDFTFTVSGAGGEYWENKGSGSYEMRDIYPLGNVSKIVDLNQDGYSDLMTWSYILEKIHFILNDTNGFFKSRVVIDQKGVSQLEVADIDFDGDDDLIFLEFVNGGYELNVRLYENENYGEPIVLIQDYGGYSFTLTQEGNQTKLIEGGTLGYYLISADLSNTYFPGELEDFYFRTLLLFPNRLEGQLDIIGFDNDYDELLQIANITTLIDADGDGYIQDEDCDDTNASINPGAEEIVNNDIDEDCDGIANIIDEDEDGFNSDEDCDDTNALINPDAEEIPLNGIDENCDGLDDLIDNDMDGFNSADDCDDSNASINPDAEEIPFNGIDENCDGDDFIDEDGDGYDSTIDCDDTDGSINPDAEEIPLNGVDENCDGLDTIVLPDIDQDGFDNTVDCDDFNPNVNPAQAELLNNSYDDNCDGETATQVLGVLVTYYFDKKVNHVLDARYWYSDRKVPVFVTDNRVYTWTSTAYDPNAGAVIADVSIIKSKRNVKGRSLLNIAYSQSTQSFNRFGTGPIFNRVLVGVQDFEIGDMNNDGYLDIIGIRENGTSNNQTFFVYYDNQYFEYEYESINLGESDHHEQIKLFDIDQDNDLDVIILNSREDNQLVVYKNQGNWDFATAEVLCSDCEGLISIDFFDADLDLDTDMLLHFSEGDHDKAGIYILENMEIDNIKPLLPNKSILCYEIGDLNNNCQNDIIFYEANTNLLAVVFDEGMADSEVQYLANTTDEVDNLLFSDINILPPFGERDLMKDLFFTYSSNNQLNLYHPFEDIVDTDQDGYSIRQDCNDCDNSVFPGAIEVPNNFEDENCDEDFEQDYIPYSISDLINTDRYKLLTEVNQKIVIQGVMHGVNFQEANGNLLFPVIDRQSTVGIMCFKYGNDVAEIPQVGDSISVYGRLEQFNGLKEFEIDDIEIHTSDLPLVQPTLAMELNEDTEGRLLRLSKVSIINPNAWQGNGNSFNISVTDGTQDFDIRITKGTEISFLSNPPTGSFDLVGIGSQFDNTAPYDENYQLLLRYESDIRIVSSTQNTGVVDNIQLYPNPANNKLYFNVGDVQSEYVIIDLLGREVLVTDSYPLDIRSLRRGTYLVKLEEQAYMFVKD